jgi:stage II sporulation protein R
MKRILVISAIIILILTINKKEDNIIIPTDAIRLRVVANSNSVNDQLIKNKISKSIQEEIYNMTYNSKSNTEVKEILNKNYDHLASSINNILESNNVNYDYKLNIGRNYFPKKIYKSIEYPSGYYDSITIELGNHQGLNWWCVIYPPLCLIDEDTESVEYTTLVSELLNDYL